MRAEVRPTERARPAFDTRCPSEIEVLLDALEINTACSPNCPSAMKSSARKEVMKRPRISMSASS